jgi:hypothetical protein
MNITQSEYSCAGCKKRNLLTENGLAFVTAIASCGREPGTYFINRQHNQTVA